MNDDPRSAEHAELGSWAAAYTLGALHPADRTRFERHLTGCALCAREVQALAPIPGLLGGVERPAAEPDDGLDERATAVGRLAGDEVARLRRSRRRWQGVAAAAAVAAVATMVVGAWPDTGDAPTGAAPVPVVRSQLEEAAISTEARPWGTEVHVELSGLPQRTVYRLWTVDRSGNRIQAATWGPTDNGVALVVGASSSAADDLHRVLVTGVDDEDVLVEARL